MGASPDGRRDGTVAAILLACALLVAAPAAHAQLPSTSAPLPGGSLFQGADGNQDDAAPLIDWQALEAADRIRHSSDANDEDTMFTGGSKETEPGDWGLTTEAGGVTPAKSNIRDAWAAVDQLGAETFLYLAFARQSADGTTFLTLELNHDGRTWDNGRAVIPCRRTGDVQISYEAQGSDVEVVIRRWTTTVADPDQGCARAGRLDTFAELRPNVDAQGAVNGVAIASRLPGAYVGSVPAQRFGEASLNVAALLEAGFGDECLGFNSFWLHSRSSTSVTSNLQDFVAPRRLAVRTCSASGTKFFDSNANGERDAGERGVPRFMVWADYDDDGVRQPVEPFAITDEDGEYVIYDIRPPDGTYTLREKLVTRLRGHRVIPAGAWNCSFPNAFTDGGTATAPGGQFGCAWGPISVAAVPNATGRDFGNWFPAQLTLEKEIEPAGDPGRFDLLLDGDVVLPSAGDGSRVTVDLPPGTYSVSERAASGTDAAAYTSTVDCRRDSPDRGRSRSGVSFEGLELSAGDVASCTFRNIRGPVPAIAIRKTGPEIAVAGDPLEYTLWVTNAGQVSFAANAIDVTDPSCDGPPRLVSKQGDATPATLDPGETWRYGCSRATEAGRPCAPARVDNSAAVTGMAGGTTVTDEDSIPTILVCPSEPESPEPIPIDPDVQPGPVAPPGPEPPNAGASGVAGLFAQATRGCIGPRVPRVDFRGSRVAGLRIFIDGRPIRRLTLRVLQRRTRPRVTLAPGRYRLRVRVRFQNGSGTPPVTLARVIRICGRPPTDPCPDPASAVRRPPAARMTSTAHRCLTVADGRLSWDR